jgi:hypothetical protein
MGERKWFVPASVSIQSMYFDVCKPDMVDSDSMTIRRCSAQIINLDHICSETSVGATYGLYMRWRWIKMCRIIKTAVFSTM